MATLTLMCHLKLCGYFTQILRRYFRHIFRGSFNLRGYSNLHGYSNLRGYYNLHGYFNLLVYFKHILHGLFNLIVRCYFNLRGYFIPWEDHDSWESQITVTEQRDLKSIFNRLNEPSKMMWKLTTN